jgi:hypothetical protein
MSGQGVRVLQTSFRSRMDIGTEGAATTDARKIKTGDHRIDRGEGTGSSSNAGATPSLIHQALSSVLQNRKTQLGRESGRAERRESPARGPAARGERAPSSLRRHPHGRFRPLTLGLWLQHSNCNRESRFLSSRRRMAVAVNESGPRPRAPACNVESCGSGFYPPRWGLHDCRRLRLGERAAPSITGYKSAFGEIPPSARKNGKQRGKSFEVGLICLPAKPPESRGSKPSCCGTCTFAFGTVEREVQ